MPVRYCKCKYNIDLLGASPVHPALGSPGLLGLSWRQRRAGGAEPKLHERGTSMPVVKVTDLAYGRLRSPSLDQAEEFLTDFGMVRAERTSDALYMRGTDPNHHLHVTHLGAPKFLGLA